MKTKRRRLWVVEVWGWTDKGWTPAYSSKTRNGAFTVAKAYRQQHAERRVRVVSYEPIPEVQLKFVGGEVVKLGPRR